MKRNRVARLTTAFLSVGLACYVILYVRGCNRLHARPGQLDLAFDVSPQGDQIVFTGAGNGKRDLYLLHLKSSRVTRLTNTPDYESDPAFSPDGRNLVYVVGVPESGDRADHLFIRSLDGTNIQQLTNEDFNDQSPAFSPDGTEIVFLRADQYITGGMVTWGTWWNPQIYIARSDGTQLRKITDSLQLFHSPLLTSLRQRTPPSPMGFNEIEGYDIGSPQFAPDGTTLVFDFRDSRYGHRQDIASINLSQNVNNWSWGLRMLTQDGHSVLPTVSPDGKQIVFISESSPWGGGGRYGRLSSLCLMQEDGSRRKPIVPTIKRNSNKSDRCMTWTRPKFSPDGKHLYFLANHDGLWRMDAIGHNLIQIADQTLFTKPTSWKAAKLSR
jgi:Tol biopolymer transport system component